MAARRVETRHRRVAHARGSGTTHRRAFAIRGLLLELRTARRATNTWRAAAADRSAALALVGRGVAALVLRSQRRALGSWVEHARARALATARLQRAVHAARATGVVRGWATWRRHAAMARAHAEKLKLAAALSDVRLAGARHREDRAVGHAFEHWAKLRRVAAALRDGGRRRRAAFATWAAEATQRAAVTRRLRAAAAGISPFGQRAALSTWTDAARRHTAQIALLRRAVAPDVWEAQLARSVRSALRRWRVAAKRHALLRRVIAALMKCELRVAFSSWAEAAAGVWRVAAAVMALSRRELRCVREHVDCRHGRPRGTARLAEFAATALLFRHYRAAFNTWVHTARELAARRRLLNSFAHDVRACRRALNTWHGAAEEQTGADASGGRPLARARARRRRPPLAGGGVAAAVAAHRRAPLERRARVHARAPPMERREGAARFAAAHRRGGGRLLDGAERRSSHRALAGGGRRRARRGVDGGGGDDGRAAHASRDAQGGGRPLAHTQRAQLASLRTAARRWRSASCAACLVTWRESSVTAATLRRAAARWVHGELARGFATWLRWRARAAASYELLHYATSRWLRALLFAAFRSWRQRAATATARRTIAMAVARRWVCIEASRCLCRWAARAAHLSRLAVAAERWRHLGCAQCVRQWAAQAAAGGHARALLIDAVEQWQQRGHRTALRRWAALGDGPRARRLAIARWRASEVTSAMRTWVRYADRVRPPRARRPPLARCRVRALSLKVATRRRTAAARSRGGQPVAQARTAPSARHVACPVVPKARRPRRTTKGGAARLAVERRDAATRPSAPRLAAVSHRSAALKDGARSADDAALVAARRHHLRQLRAVDEPQLPQVEAEGSAAWRGVDAADAPAAAAAGAADNAPAAGALGSSLHRPRAAAGATAARGGHRAADAPWRGHQRLGGLAGGRGGGACARRTRSYGDGARAPARRCAACGVGCASVQ